MMPVKDFYMADDVDMQVLVKDLNTILTNFYISIKTIELLSKIREGTIIDFINTKKGISYEESCRIYQVVFNLKSVCERFYC